MFWPSSKIVQIAARAHGVSREAPQPSCSKQYNSCNTLSIWFWPGRHTIIKGTPLELLMGLGEGSRAAPLGMRGVVTLALNSYKTIGQGKGMKAKLSHHSQLLVLFTGASSTISTTRPSTPKFRPQSTTGESSFKPLTILSNKLRVFTMSCPGNSSKAGQPSLPSPSIPPSNSPSHNLLAPLSPPSLPQRHRPLCHGLGYMEQSY
jgi:hypothetical protein